MSGQRIKLEKSCVVLCGKDAWRKVGTGDTNDPQLLWPGMPFSTRGIVVSKYHGVMITDETGAATQWDKNVTKVIDMINHDARVFVPTSIDGRQHLAQGKYIGKLAYTFKYQVPDQSTVETQLRRVDDALAERTLGTKWIKQELALQRKEDCGLNLATARHTMQAAWAGAIRRLMEPAPQPWKHFARHYVRKAYGNTLGKGTMMLTANVSYSIITDLPRGAITEKMRQAFTNAGKLPRLRPMQSPYRDVTTVRTDESKSLMAAARAPTTPRHIAYYVMRVQDTAAAGITPRTKSQPNTQHQG